MKVLDNIDDDTKCKLQKLWFVFGNRGPKHTMGNHKFIQRLLDKDPPEDHREFYDPTNECIKAVDKILKG